MGGWFGDCGGDVDGGLSGIQREWEKVRKRMGHHLDSRSELAELP